MAIGLVGNLKSPKIPGQINLNETPNMNFQNVAHYHFRIGEIEATALSDGQTLFPAYPSYAINANEEEVQATLKNHFFSTNLYRLQCTILHLKVSEKSILIDTGAGNTLGNDLGNLDANLRRAGIDPDEITDILLTHCHLDHIGGLMINNEAAFTNAIIHLSDKEWSFWSSKSIDLSGMPLDQSFRDNFIRAARNNLNPLADRIKTFRFNEEVISGIQAINAVGHSPGHTNYLIKSGEESLLHTGDIFHHNGFDLDHPKWATAFDQDIKKAYQTRKMVLDMASVDRIFLASYHMPFPSIGHVFKKGNSYGWVPSQWIL
ncbi:MAG: MBL fold metallo-hydrolase [Bacteroidota bacterium]